MSYLVIKANRTEGYQIAYLYDCICITYFGTVHTSVRGDIAGTITVRPGEYGVVVRKT